MFLAWQFADSRFNAALQGAGFDMNCPRDMGLHEVGFAAAVDDQQGWISQMFAELFRFNKWCQHSDLPCLLWMRVDCNWSGGHRKRRAAVLRALCENKCPMQARESELGVAG